VNYLPSSVDMHLSVFCRICFTCSISKREVRSKSKESRSTGRFDLAILITFLKPKWHEKQTPRSDLVYFESKVGTKLENTLGLFISMNGFESSAISNRGGRRPDLILMDGADIAAVLEGRIGLPKLIDGKKTTCSADWGNHDQRVSVNLKSSENGWIERDQLLEAANRYGKSPYGMHLRDVAERRIISRPED
jgi:hypothetical protein